MLEWVVALGMSSSLSSFSSSSVAGGVVEPEATPSEIIEGSRSPETANVGTPSTSSGGRPSIPSAPSSYSSPNSSARSLEPEVGSGKSAAASSWARDEAPPRSEAFDLLRDKECFGDGFLEDEDGTERKWESSSSGS